MSDESTADPKTSTFLVTHADDDSAVLKDVHNGQVHTLAENPGVDVGEAIEGTVAPEPPMEVTYELVDVADRRDIPVEIVDLDPTAQAKDLAAEGLTTPAEVREAGETPRLFDFWSLSPSRIGQLALLSVLLLVFFLTWARLAQFLFAAMTVGNAMPAGQFTQFLFTTPAGLTLLVVGTAVGAVLAFVTFAVSALAFPMLTDQDVDAVTAVVASVKAVIQQPFTMITWAWLIAFFVAVGSVLFFVGLAVAFPWLAHASWRAYKDFNPRPEAPAPRPVRG